MYACYYRECNSNWFCLWSFIELDVQEIYLKSFLCMMRLMRLEVFFIEMEVEKLFGYLIKVYVLEYLIGTLCGVKYLVKFFFFKLWRERERYFQCGVNYFVKVSLINKIMTI